MPTNCSGTFFFCEGSSTSLKKTLKAHKRKGGKVRSIFLNLHRDLRVALKIFDLPAVFCGKKIKIFSVEYIHEWGNIGMLTGAKSNP